MNELTDIRKKGYSTSLGERILGSACVSVLVRNYSFPVVLSVFGPQYRFSDKKHLIIKMGMDTADLISQQLKRLGGAPS